MRPDVVARIPGASPRRLRDSGAYGRCASGRALPTGTLRIRGRLSSTATRSGGRRARRTTSRPSSAGLLVAQELKAQGITPDLSLGLIFASDQETSGPSRIHYILKTHADLFGPDDFVVVPDYGVADGSSVETSEKGQLSMRQVEVLGRRCHASRPQEGRNSLVAASTTSCMSGILESIRAQVESAVPAPGAPRSSRRATKRTSPTSIPCRARTCSTSTAAFCRASATTTCSPPHGRSLEAVAERHGVTVDVAAVTDAPASPATPPDSEVVLRLSAGIRGIHGIEPHCDGSGGGTVAVGFRDMGIPAAVWASVVPTSSSRQRVLPDFPHPRRRAGARPDAVRLRDDEDWGGGTLLEKGFPSPDAPSFPAQDFCTGR